MKRFGVYPELNPLGDSIYFGSQSSSHKEWILSGRLSEYGRRYQVRMDVSNEKVIAIFGKRGQGKSFTLGSIIEGMCTSENHTSISCDANNRAILLFDTLDIFQWMGVPLNKDWENKSELDRQADLLSGWDIKAEKLMVDVWVPAGYENEVINQNHRIFKLNIPDLQIDDWGNLLGIDIMRDVMGQYLYEIFHKVTVLGWTDLNGNYHLGNVNYSLEDLIECIDNDEDNNKGIFKDDTRRAILQRIRSFQVHPLFSHEGTKLSLFLKSGHVTVLLLGRLPDDLRSVLVSVLIRRILKERKIAAELSKELMLNPSISEEEKLSRRKILETAIPKSWIVIDEAQNIVPSGKKTFASDSIVKLVKEGRNFGISFLVTTQEPSAIDKSVLSQVETFIVHKLVSFSDIRFVLDNIKSPLPTEIEDDNQKISVEELILSLSIGQVLISDTDMPRGFCMEVRPRISAHGGIEA